MESIRWRSTHIGTGSIKIAETEATGRMVADLSMADLMTKKSDLFLQIAKQKEKKK